MSETQTASLTEFLLARIAEDEAAARSAGADAMVGARWKHYPEDAYDEIQATVIAHSRRTLAECEAKRRIVERYLSAATNDLVPDDDAVANAVLGELEHTIATLALPHADHPDYRAEWRP